MRTILVTVLVGLLLGTPCTAQAADPPRRGARDCAQCPEIVRIPPGSFMMGAAPDEHEVQNVPAKLARLELPQHRVMIGYSFWLGKYEVTRAEFAAFVDATGHQVAAWHPEPGDWRNPKFSQTDRDPVVSVDWNDAKAYVAWLSRTTGKKYRLPSEAEWEYAARAGTTTARYWGDRYEEACRYANVGDRSHGCQDGYVTTAPVGTFQANQFGLHDMLGNVFEWIEDCENETYRGAPADGSSWQHGDCTRRVLRGGSWSSIPVAVRAAVRGFGKPVLRGNYVGFRVARAD